MAMSTVEAAIVAAVLVDEVCCAQCLAIDLCKLDRDLPWVDWYVLGAEASDGRFDADELRALAPCAKAAAAVG